MILPPSLWAQTSRGANPELQELKAQMAAQQEQIRQLQELLRQQGTLLEALQEKLGLALPMVPHEAASAPSAAFAPETLEKRVEQLETAVAETKKEGESWRKRLSSFSFSGDLRVRYEPFFQEGAEFRNRERARFRFQGVASISKELTGGFRLATGALDNPGSTNQSFSGFFTHKLVTLDRFWLSYRPERASWLTVTAGKFEPPWYRTELTFDNDLNPEGFAQTLSFDFKDSPLTNLKLVGFELPFNELSAAGDSFIWGGQVQTHWKLSERARLGFYAAGLNFRNADAIAVAIGNRSLNPSLGLSNHVRRDGSGNIIGYEEQFTYLDLIAELRYAWQPRWPLRLTFNFVNNLRASDERSGYWAELNVGRLDEKGDWLFGYTLMRIEREAVIGAYNFDDLRSATNVLGHRVRTAYQIHRSVTLDYTLLVGRLFNPHDTLNLVPAPFQPQGKDPYLKRMQFDVIYKF
ncbi:MAG TPA: putative porin [Candidatus Xenobia bacterium]|nr:putative porin [Candidatus Xenobia bacterium]